MRSIWAMTRANLKMSLRNRQALFWNLAFPALFILIFGAVFGRGLKIDINVGLIEPLNDYGEQVAAAMSSTSAFTVTRGSQEAELAALEAGTRSVVLAFPGPGDPPAATIYSGPMTDPNSAVAQSAVREVLLAASGSALPVTISAETVNAAQISFMDTFLPGILAMSLMNSGIIGLSTAFVNYRERGILRRIKVTPFPLTSFIFARVLSQVLMAVLQSVILVGMAWALFDFRPRGNLTVIFLTILIGALAFLAIGFAISGISPNAETAASYANLITFPMLFLSGIFFSMSNAPAWLQPITKVLPLPYLVEALRSVMTYGHGLSAIWIDLVVLLGVFAVAMVIAVRFFRWDSRSA